MFSTNFALYVFLGWARIQAAILVVSLIQGKALADMRLAVEKVEASEIEGEKTQLAKGFIWISVVWFVAITVISAFAFHAAAAGSILGIIIFTMVGGWSLYETASSPIVLGKMYPTSVGRRDWLVAIDNSLVWAYLFVVLAAHWLSYVS
ncbi:MAG: hypothetical protein P8103_17180 [Candidatus Thiodiazotropha sp.]